MVVLLLFFSIDEFFINIYIVYSEFNYEMILIYFLYWLIFLLIERCLNIFCLDNGINDKSSSFDDKKFID